MVTQGSGFKVLAVECETIRGLPVCSAFAPAQALISCGPRIAPSTMKGLGVFVATVLSSLSQVAYAQTGDAVDRLKACSLVQGSAVEVRR
jgi:hypothetical protein